MSLTSKEAIKIIIGSEFLVGLEACTTAAEDDDGRRQAPLIAKSRKWPQAVQQHVLHQQQ